MVDMNINAPERPDLQVSFRAMASTVRVRIVEPRPGAELAVGCAQQVFDRVEAACTRFDPDSALMRANRAGRRWTDVPSECAAAIAEAAAAHHLTGGRFDPRVLTILESYGYTRSLPFASGDVRVSGTRPAARRRRPRGAWRPGVDATRPAVRIGPVPVDLGGIGKGLAVRWAAAELRGAGSAVLLEAGGDAVAHGVGPDGCGWAIAVEDPTGGREPVAVLRLTDRAVATSSIRLRRWRVGDRPVHHLIDPRTGEPAAADLLAVTVVADDPALAEVWSKALFVAGRTEVRSVAQDHRLAALWVRSDGRVAMSRAMRPYVIWEASDDC